MARNLVFDHAVIVVHDLNTAIANFTSLGFTVFYGGKHSNGATHNALIVFEDSSYIELIAPTGERAGGNGSGPGFQSVFGTREGLAGYALRTDNLGADVAAMRAQGVNINDMTPGGRARPDGQELRWQIAMLEGTMSPFFIQDDTPRELRVPNDADKIHHKNGVKGVAGLTLVVNELELPTLLYESLLDVTAKEDETRSRFVVNGVVLRLSLPIDDEMRDYLEDRGELPYMLTLRTYDSEAAGTLDSGKTNHARIALVE